MKYVKIYIGNNNCWSKFLFTHRHSFFLSIFCLISCSSSARSLDNIFGHLVANEYRFVYLQEDTTAQLFRVSGLVVDANNKPLSEVAVFEKGIKNNTVTSSDGKFFIDVVDDKAVLIFSHSDYTTQEVLVNTDLQIKMELGPELLEDVVVTALGIKKGKRALTYNVQEIKSGDISGIKNVNFMNSLSGKVAGMQLSTSTSGVAGSTRVILRGTKSLLGNNDALYVIDGVPLVSTKSDQNGGNIFENPDGGDGDGISLLNPDDIESISVLTGAASAALYGEQGANGVILINTKKGGTEKLGVSYSNNTTFMDPFVMPRFQNKYGSKPGDFSSWGDQLETPSSYNPKSFFQTGYNETNSIGVSTGNKKNQTYFSVSSTIARGIVPNNDLNRHNVFLNNTTQLIQDKLILGVNVAYMNQTDKNGVAQGLYHNPLVPVYLFPRGDDIEKYQAYERYDPSRNFNVQYWPYQNQGLNIQNPYWIVNRELFENNRVRVFYAASLKYNILNWINITGRARRDSYEVDFDRKISASSDKLFASDKGNYLHSKSSNVQIYSDVILNIDKKINVFSIIANLGYSILDSRRDVAGFEGHLSTVPDLFSYSNINLADLNTLLIQDRYHDQTQAVFGTAQLGFKSYAYLDVTARNEWPSRLYGSTVSKIFYPSVGLSVVISNMLKIPKEIISFLKVRGSYSEVGNAPPRYRTQPFYDLTKGILSNQPTYPAYNLKPERTQALEVGTNIGLWQNRFDISFTYYNTNTFNQIFNVSLPSSTGYSSFLINAGKVNNYGIEASLGYNDKFGEVSWSSKIIYSRNKNVVKELIPDGLINPVTGNPIKKTDELIVTNVPGSYRMVLTEGGTMGDIYATTFKKDYDGYTYVTPTGDINSDPTNFIKVGSTIPDFLLSWNNSIEYKGITLSFLFSGRFGGVGVSPTQALMDRFGVSETSAEARDNGGVPVLQGGKIQPQNYFSVSGNGNTGYYPSMFIVLLM